MPLPYPENTIWYVEATSSKPGRSDGSAVAIRLKKPGDQEIPRTYLLTCAHVVRGISKDRKPGFGPVLSQLLVWAPDTGYNIAQAKVAKIVKDIKPDLDLEDELSDEHSNASDDWVVLEVDDPQASTAAPAIREWVDADLAGDFRIYGYPGGDASFVQGKVTPTRTPDSFPFRDEFHGELILNGDGTRPGISGGGVFKEADRKFAGLHRARADDTLQVHAVSARTIRQRLEELGYQVVCAGPDIPSDPPPEDVLRHWRAELDGYLARELSLAEALGDHTSLAKRPLENLWNDFLIQRPWHVQIGEALAIIAQMADDEPRFRPILGSTPWPVDLGQTYRDIQASLQRYRIDRIRRQLNSLLQPLDQPGRAPSRGRPQPQDPAAEQLRNDVRSLRDLLFKLRSKINFPAFERGFLIQGSLGAGKTHFLASLLEGEGDLSKGVLILPLNWRDCLRTRQSLEKQVIEEIRRYSRVDNWVDLGHFNAFLGKAGVKLVVAIDDLQRWISAEDRLLEEIRGILDDSTRLHNVFWLLTLHDTYYDQVSPLETVWIEYGFPGRLPPRYLGDRKAAAEPVVAPAGWIQLDDWNRREQIGAEILRAGIADRDGFEESEEDLPLLDSEECGENLPRELSNPANAWIAVDLIQNELIEPQSIINLRYLEFTDNLKTLRLKRLNLQTTRFTKEAKKLEQLDPEAAITLFGDVLRQAGEQPLYLEDVTRSLAKLGTERHHRLGDADLARLAIMALEDMSLILMIDEDPELHVKVVDLNFPTFWHRWMANSLRRLCREKDWDAAAAQVELCRWIAATKSDFMREGVWEFFLLLLDRDVHGSPGQGQGKPPAEFASQVWKLTLTAAGWPVASAWLGGVKALPQTQGLLATSVPKGDGSDLSPRVLFSLMYFAAYADIFNPDPARRLGLLQPFHASIRARSYSEYFRSIAQRVVYGGLAPNKLVDCMMNLSGCEKMGLAEDLAWMCVDSLIISVGQDSVEGLLDPIFDFLRRNGKIAEEQYEERNRERSIREAARQRPATPRESDPLLSEERDTEPEQEGWVRVFFREHVLNVFCEHVIRVLGVKAYEVLDRANWYGGDRRGIHLKVRFEMQREASIAFGSWFRGNKNEKKHAAYGRLVNSLATSRNQYNKTTALYLIVHTVIKEQRSHLAIDPILLPSLVALNEDQDSRRRPDQYQMFIREVERNREFIDFNLNHAGR
jgi:hypothetical protein